MSTSSEEEEYGGIKFVKSDSDDDDMTFSAVTRPSVVKVEFSEQSSSDKKKDKHKKDKHHHHSSKKEKSKEESKSKMDVQGSTSKRAVSIFGPPTVLYVDEKRSKDSFSLWMYRDLRKNGIKYLHQVVVKNEIFFITILVRIHKEDVCDILSLDPSFSYDNIDHLFTCRSSSLSSCIGKLLLVTRIAKGSVSVKDAKKSDLVSVISKKAQTSTSDFTRYAKGAKT